MAGLLEGVDEEERTKILEGGDEAVQAYLDKNGIEGNVADVRKAGAEAALEEFQATNEAGAWWQGHERRAKAITEKMYDLTSRSTQWDISGDPMTGGGLNQKSAAGLHEMTDWKAFDKDTSQILADVPTELTGAKSDNKKDWRLGLANKLPTGTIEPEKDGGEEYGG